MDKYDLYDYVKDPTNHSFFKAMVINFDETGKETGRYIHNKIYKTYSKAREAAIKALVPEKSPFYICEIREYDDRKPHNVITFNLSNDTAISVHRDIDTVTETLHNLFDKTNKEFLDDWDSTMSYMIDCIKCDSFEDWAYLKDAINLLTDEEINDILEYYGDDEYCICKNGEIISIDYSDKEEV